MNSQSAELVLGDFPALFPEHEDEEGNSDADIVYSDDEGAFDDYCTYEKIKSHKLMIGPFKGQTYRKLIKSVGGRESLRGLLVTI